jgi:serine/threonine-protein kinase
MAIVRAGLFIGERYEIITHIGSGGTADVYKAKDHRLNRFVAIKILKQSFTGDPKIIAKFQQEAQSCAGLTHPNIVSIYDVGSDGDLNYIVMELIEGITLKKFIERKGRLEIKEAVGIAIQIAQGLDAAHANHVVHRDIKPQNIIISREGKVKVTDFGIARATFGTSSNTINQAPVGSVHYLSPEQARGGFSDEKSDIYSLGVTIYEMLSGRVPYSGENNVSIALLHIQGDPTPLHNLNPNVTPALEKIVAKCMQKKPERRYFSASELIRDLKAAITDPSGDFVKINAPKVNDSPTISITEEEIKSIKAQAQTDLSDDEPEHDIDDSEDDDLDPVNSKTEKIIIVASIVLVVLFIGVIIFFVASDINPFSSSSSTNSTSDDGVHKLSSTEITMLKSMNYTLDELAQVLEEKYGITSNDYSNRAEVSDTVDQNHIIDIYYDDDGALVVVWSSGPKPADSVTMINVTGYDLQTAKDMLMALSDEFVIETVASAVNTDDAANTVIQQSVDEGAAVTVNSTITLTYSIGPEQVQVPDMSGYTQAMVETAYGTSFAITYAYDTENDYSTTTSDVVVRTDPAIGDPVDKGGAITVYLSTPYVNYVPSVLGKSQEEAKKILESVSLKVTVDTETVYSDYAEGTVCEQSATGSKALNRGSSITIKLSKGPAPTATPTPTEEPTQAPTATLTPTPSPEPTSASTSTPIPTESGETGGETGSDNGDEGEEDFD